MYITLFKLIKDEKEEQPKIQNKQITKQKMIGVHYNFNEYIQKISNGSTKATSQNSNKNESIFKGSGIKIHK